MNFNHLIAINNLDNSISVSISPDDKEWYKLGDGEEFLAGISISIKGAYVDDDKTIEPEDIDKMEKKKLVSICELEGTLILAAEMVQEDYSPHEVCDGYSGDLEFIYSILQQYELEMNDEFEIRNILYIEAIKWDTNVDLKTKKKVLGQLKGFTIHLYRTVPHLTCYYIAPTSYDYKERILSDERSRLLTKKVSDILDEPKEPIDNNIIDLSRHISFSENEVNEHLGRRTIGETYPKGMINIDEYHSFIDLGFQEVDETRLMIKLV